MQVRLHGFALEGTSKTVSLRELFVRLKAESGPLAVWRKIERKLLVQIVGGYAIGLFVTVKDQRVFTEMIEEDGELRLEARQVEEGKSFAEFNYFVVNLDTGRGIYQHYHSSCKFTQFGGFLADRYAKIVRNEADSAIASASLNGKVSKARQKQIRSDYVGYLDWSVLVRPEKVDELLADLREITQYQYDLVTFTPDENQPFRPISSFVSKKRTILTFDKKIQVAQRVRRGIMDMISRNRPAKGRIRGKDVQGRKQVIDLDENVDILREYDYDEVAGEIRIKLGSCDNPDWSYTHSPMVGRLMDEVKANRALFETRVDKGK